MTKTRLFIPLQMQIFGMFALNVAILLLINMYARNGASHMGWESIVYEPIQQRFQGVSFITWRQLELLPPDSWTAALNDLGKIYGVEFYLFELSGRQKAGARIAPPPSVLELMKQSSRRFQHQGMKVRKDFLSGSTVVPPPPNGFLVHTDNPNMYWIGNPVPPLRIRDRGRFEGPPPLPGLHPDGPLPNGELPPFGGPPGPGSPMLFPPEQSLILLAATPSIWQTRLVADFSMTTLISAAIVLGSFVLWIPYLHAMSAALKKVTRATEKIAEGNFDNLVGSNRPDEIGRLSRAVDSMAGRLQRLIHGQKRFLGDTAHELGAPIARLQVALELVDTEDGTQRRALIDDIREDVEQMGFLINELLAFSRAALQSEPPVLQPLAVRVLLDKVVQHLGLSYPVHLDVASNLVVKGDALLLERAFGNVLRNAARYAATGEPFTVNAVKVGDQVIINFLDEGPGVPPESLRLLDEPFYRPESSRSREFGGAGLGLAIVKTCVETCGGTLSISNRQPRGLDVEIKLQASDGENLAGS